MTREEARQNLVALGIEEPTEAQVTNYLNQFHSNRQPAQAPVQNPAQSLDTNQSPAPNPEQEPHNSELENALNRIMELENENRRKDIAAYASAKGLTGEQADKILNAFGDNVDSAKVAVDSISQIISDNRTAAAQEKEQELAGRATNPGGGSSNNPGGEKSSAEKLAAKFFSGQKQETNILSHYVGGN